MLRAHTAPGPLVPQGVSLLPVDALHALVIDVIAFSAKQRVDPWRAVSHTSLHDLLHPYDQLCIIPSAVRFVAVG
jgi:hypothetical protein